MPTTIAKNSVETVSHLIRKEFDTFTEFWQEQEAKQLIKTARDFGLTDLANEMQNDLK